MKRLLSIVLATIVAGFALSSCDATDRNQEKSYSVICNLNTSIRTSIIVFECDDTGTKFTSHTIDDVEEGKEYTYTSIPEATRIKIYYEQESVFGTTAKWVQQVFLLRDNENIEIFIDDNTIVGNKEP